MGLFNSLCSFGFAISVILNVAVPSNAAAVRKRGTDCDVGPGWASPVLSVGGGDSSDPSYVYACETQYGGDHTPVSAIEVWRKGDDTGGRISGLQFKYTSGKTSPIYGTEDTSKYPSDNMILVPGELIKNAILYGDGQGTYLGHIHIETSTQIFDAGADTSDKNPYGINVGSGLLYGANVLTHAQDPGAGADIASLAFLFLGQAIDHISVDDVTFNNDPSGTNTGISPQNVVVGQWFDDSQNNVGYSLSPTYTVTSSYSYSQSTTFSFGGAIKVELSAKLFGIGATEELSFTWEVSHEVATTTGTTSATAIACVATGTLSPNQGVKVTGTYQTGVGIFDYTSTVTVHLKDGTSFSYNEPGTLTNVAYNQCSTRFTTDNSGSKKVPNSPGLSVITTAPSATPLPKI